MNDVSQRGRKDEFLSYCMIVFVREKCQTDVTSFVIGPLKLCTLAYLLLPGLVWCKNCVQTITQQCVDYYYKNCNCHSNLGPMQICLTPQGKFRNLYLSLKQYLNKGCDTFLRLKQNFGHFVLQPLRRKYFLELAPLINYSFVFKQI